MYSHRKVLKTCNEMLLQKDEEGHCAYRCYGQKDSFVMSQACEAMPIYWHMVPAYAQKDIACAFVKEGETTLGEYWKKNPRSHCHDMMGSIIEWYSTGIAGIEIRKPGLKEISIHPYMPESMNSFDCSYETSYGTIEVHDRRKERKPVLTWIVLSDIKVIA